MATSSMSSSGEVDAANKRKRHDKSPQKEALETIYHSLGGPQWKNHDHWLSDDHHFSEWHGVRCSSTTDNGGEKSWHVTALELSQNNLHGRLDDPVVVAGFLKIAASLDQLWLSENALTGTVPSLFCSNNFPSLTIVDVGSNKLRGSLHPCFGTSTKFSWFDTSGNELTSYYRCTNDDEDDLKNALEVNALATTSPFDHVHVVPSLLTKDQSAALINLAISYTEANGGWQTDRHKAYQTTDIDLAICGGELLDSCNLYLKTRILPLLSTIFNSDDNDDFCIADFAIEDLFLAKYAAAKGQQNALSEHRDGSEVSFVITLNDPKTDFSGGGTRFMVAPEPMILAPDTPGTGVFFCGRYLHSGVAVTEGTRYILAGFVRVYPSTPKGEKRLVSMLKAVSEV